MGMTFQFRACLDSRLHGNGEGARGNDVATHLRYAESGGKARIRWLSIVGCRLSVVGCVV